jgi:hypothetical protein
MPRHVYPYITHKTNERVKERCTALLSSPISIISPITVPVRSSGIRKRDRELGFNVIFLFPSPSESESVYYYPTSPLSLLPPLSSFSRLSPPSPPINPSFQESKSNQTQTHTHNHNHINARQTSLCNNNTTETKQNKTNATKTKEQKRNPKRF